MEIIVDADACPVKEIIVRNAKKRGIKVVMFVCTSHVIIDDYSEVITVEKAQDSVDFAIINYLSKHNKTALVVTQDYGLASIVISKDCYAIHPNGFLFTQNNIDKLLFERHINKELRRMKKRSHTIPKRTVENNENFEKAFIKVLDSSKETKED